MEKELQKELRDGVKAKKKKKKKHPAVDVTGDGREIQCCKEQYCIGDWNVGFMNRGKFESGQTGDGKNVHQYFRNE